MLPNGGAGRNYIREMARLLNSWNEESPLKDIAMKAIHIMPALLLQKPSKTSKSKDNLKALERRLEVWNKGDILALFKEAETLQQRLPKPQEKSVIASISRRFKNFMESGNVNGAIRDSINKSCYPSRFGFRYSPNICTATTSLLLDNNSYAALSTPIMQTSTPSWDRIGTGPF